MYLVLSLFSSLSLIHRPSQYFRFPFHELCFVPIAIPFPTVCMSRPSRNLPSLDYKELDRTGRRVYKARDNQPKMEDLRTAAIKIESDVEDLFDSYDIKEITEEDDLQDYVGEVKVLKQEYRRIHAQLKSAAGDDFANLYPDYDKTMKKLNEEFKTATKKFSDARKESRKPVVASPLPDRERTQILSKRVYFIEQVRAEIASSDIEKLTQFEQIKMHIDHFQTRSDKFLEICSDLDVIYGPDDHGLNDENLKLRNEIRGLVEKGNKKLYQIDAANKSVELERAASVEEEKRLKRESLLACAKDLKHEIDIRHESLVKKLTIDFTKLSDFEILDLKKQVSSLHTELRELIDKVSGFKKFIVQCEDSAADLSKDATSKSDACNTALSKYLDKLVETVASRDISEKKLSTSAGLKIDFKKFQVMILPWTFIRLNVIFRRTSSPIFRKVCGEII